MEIQRNRSLDKGERSCLGASPSLHDLHGFQHETRRSSMPDVSGRLQLHSAIDGDSWPASREASSMAVAVWYHHALRAPVSPVRVTWLAVSPPLERVMRVAVNRRSDSHLETPRPHTASQCRIIPFRLLSSQWNCEARCYGHRSSHGANGAQGRSVSAWHCSTLCGHCSVRPSLRASRSRSTAAITSGAIASARKSPHCVAPPLGR